MKRRLTKLVVFLLLGAIVNVGVAWGCAGWSDWLDLITLLETPVTTETSGTISAPSAWRLDNMPKSWPDKPTHAFTRHTGWFLFTDQVRSLDDEALFRLVDRRFGVPTKSLACYELAVLQTGTWTNSWRYGIARFGGDYPLPLRPIWPSFAINPIFFGAILWLLASGPFIVRRMIRRRRGLCIKCGYDLRGTPGGGGACPECGMVFCDEGNR